MVFLRRRRCRSRAFQSQPRQLRRCDEVTKEPAEACGQAWKDHARDEWHRHQQTDGGGEERTADNAPAAAMKTLQGHTQTAASAAAAALFIQQAAVDCLRNPMLRPHDHWAERYKV